MRMDGMCARTIPSHHHTRLHFVVRGRLAEEKDDELRGVIDPMHTFGQSGLLGNRSATVGGANTGAGAGAGAAGANAGWVVRCDVMGCDPSVCVLLCARLGCLL